MGQDRLAEGENVTCTINIQQNATHSSVLAWRTPGTEEPGRLQSIGSQRVGHDWSDLAQHKMEVWIFYFLSSSKNTFGEQLFFQRWDNSY